MRIPKLLIAGFVPVMTSMDAARGQPALHVEKETISGPAEGAESR